MYTPLHKWNPVHHHYPPDNYPYHSYNRPMIVPSPSCPACPACPSSYPTPDPCPDGLREYCDETDGSDVLCSPCYPSLVGRTNRGDENLMRYFILSDPASNYNMIEGFRR